MCWAVRLRTEGTLEGPVCPAPIPISPKGGYTVYTSNPTLMWSPPPGVVPGSILEYQVRMAENPSFNPTLYGRYVSGTITQHTVDYRYMQDNLTLYWDVRAKVSEGWGAWSESAVFIVNLSLLTPPRLIRPQRDALLTELKPTFEWEAIPNATHYRIQISERPEFLGDMMMAGISSTTFTPDANLKENTQYYWRVCGIKESTVGSFSEGGRFRILTALPPITLESPPNGSLVRSITPGPVLNWRSFPGGGGYKVQLSTRRDFTDATTRTVYNNFYEVPSGSLENGNTYYWRVRQGASGTEWRSIDPIWSFTVNVIPDMPWITHPPSGSRISNLRPTLAWNAIPYAASYVLELREGSMSGPLVFPRVYPTTTSFTAPNDLALNKKYVWIIKACNRNNECSGPAIGWFEVAIELRRPDIIPKKPATKLPEPAAPAKPPVK